MTRAYVTARLPADVAREVEFLSKEGCSSFILRMLDGGSMLDRERLGAARYAAGLQAEVELDGQPAPAAVASDEPGVAAPEVARAR